MLALGMERVGIESSRARRTRSVCVVALTIHQTIPRHMCSCLDIPKWISNHEESDVDLVGILEYVVA
jgi:hypothetical protein